MLHIILFKMSVLSNAAIHILKAIMAITIGYFPIPWKLAHVITSSLRTTGQIDYSGS